MSGLFTPCKEIKIWNAGGTSLIMGSDAIRRVGIHEGMAPEHTSLLFYYGLIQTLPDEKRCFITETRKE